jgi:hypothetical protein
MTEKIMRENLFVIAQAYATAKGLSLTTISKEIHGNGGFFAGFIAGELSTGLDTYFTMLNRMRSRWPRKTPWPKTNGMQKLGKKVDAGFRDE